MSVTSPSCENLRRQVVFSRIARGGTPLKGEIMSSRDYDAPLWDTAEELNRDECFNDLAYRNMTFDRDDRPEHLLSKAARAYAENFQPALEQHGIMFTGNVGTGKTFYACCIANAVIDRGCTAWVTTLQPLVRALCSYEAAEKILAKIRKVDLLVLDDLGSTALNDFTTDKIFEIVDERYRSGKPLIVTTNLNPDEAWKSSIGMRRIFDRLRERCRHVVMDGESRRRAC